MLSLYFHTHLPLYLVVITITYCHWPVGCWGFYLQCITVYWTVTPPKQVTWAENSILLWQAAAVNLLLMWIAVICTWTQLVVTWLVVVSSREPAPPITSSCPHLVHFLVTVTTLSGQTWMKIKADWPGMTEPTDYRVILLIIDYLWKQNNEQYNVCLHTYILYTRSSDRWNQNKNSTSLSLSLFFFPRGQYLNKGLVHASKGLQK